MPILGIMIELLILGKARNGSTKPLLWTSGGYTLVSSGIGSEYAGK